MLGRFKSNQKIANCYKYIYIFGENFLVWIFRRVKICHGYDIDKGTICFSSSFFELIIVEKKEGRGLDSKAFHGRTILMMYE